jgi:hypothetical protein
LANWVERNRSRLDEIRLYISGFQDRPPAPFAWFADGGKAAIPLAPGSDRGVALLLAFCALYQGISEARLMALLANLWNAYGQDFLRLNKLPFEDLQARIDAQPGLGEWSIRKQAPGILRSLCDFFYRHGGPMAWVRSVGDGEECVRVLCEEVFLMGKTSLFKSKPRYFLWLLTQLPDAHPEAFWGERTLLPITPGHLRFLREFGPLNGRRSVPWRGPEEKLAYVNRFFRLLAPEAPWSAYAPLDAYLKPMDPKRTPPQWECRVVLGGCLQCPLAAYCPGREEV